MALARAFHNRIETHLYRCAVYGQIPDYKTLQQYTDSILSGHLLSPVLHNSLKFPASLLNCANRAIYLKNRSFYLLIITTCVKNAILYDNSL